MKQKKMTELREVENSTIIVGNVSTPLSIMDITIRKSARKLKTSTKLSTKGA